MKIMKPSLFSPPHFTTAMNESVGSTTISEAIARNHNILFDHFFHPLFDKASYIKLLKDIRAVTNDPALQAKLESNWHNELGQQHEAINALLHHVKYACLHLELATTAEAHADHDRAWAFTNYASLMIGEIIEKSAAVLSSMEADDLSVKNSKNAQGRNKSILLVKGEAARLLKENRPKDGWPTKVKAVTDLEEPLGDFIEKNKIPILQISNIEKWLTAWLREDELVNRAWETNKSIKIR